jgi:hypothetical protein
MNATNNSLSKSLSKEQANRERNSFVGLQDYPQGAGEDGAFYTAQKPVKQQEKPGQKSKNSRDLPADVQQTPYSLKQQEAVYNQMLGSEQKNNKFSGYQEEAQNMVKSGS